MGGGEVAALKRNPLHTGEYAIRRQPRFDRERLDRRLQKTGFLFHARTLKHKKHTTEERRTRRNIPRCPLCPPWWRVSSERVPHAGVDRRAVSDGVTAVVSPCDATGDRHREKVADREARGDLSTDRRLDVLRAKGLRPRVAGVGENGAMQRMQEERPCAIASLRARD